MSQPDDLDALLASLLIAPAPTPEPEAEPEAEATPAPVVATLALPELPAEAVAAVVTLRTWLDVAEPGAVLEPVVFDPPAPEPEQLDPETLLELAAARAWRSGDQKAFDKALTRLPADRADHHRRMAAVCDLISSRQEARAQLKGEVPDTTSPAASVGSP